MDGKSRLLTLIFLLAALIQNAYSGECYDELPSASLTTGMNWIKASVDRHNFYRVQHGVCPLKFNQKLSEIAQEWANNLARHDVFEHSENKCIGENLARRGSTAAFKIESNFAVDGWYNEIKDYNFKSGTGTPGAMIGHLTQVLWSDSREVGVAYASYERDGWTHYVVVANYYPPGNYIGQNPDKVFPKGRPLPNECKGAQTPNSTGATGELNAPGSGWKIAPTHMVLQTCLTGLAILIATTVIN